jgi:hypothetical protein
MAHKALRVARAVSPVRCRIGLVEDLSGETAHLRQLAEAVADIQAGCVLFGDEEQRALVVTELVAGHRAAKRGRGDGNRGAAGATGGDPRRRPRPAGGKRLI